MHKRFILSTIVLYLLASCNNGNEYKSIESDESNRSKSGQESGIVHSSSDDNWMVTCPICMGNGEGVCFDTYQICPVCKGDKVIPQKWIDEANHQSASADMYDDVEVEPSDDQRQYIENEISRLEQVIQMAESGMENCSSDILILQYKNQITEAEYEIRRLRGLLNDF